MTKSEEAFVDQMTRKMLVGWCQYYIETGMLPSDLDPNKSVFVKHAIDKGWLASSLLKVLSKGFDTAAAFLRR
jgi:hypothetical protein